MKTSIELVFQISEFSLRKFSDDLLRPEDKAHCKFTRSSSKGLNFSHCYLETILFIVILTGGHIKIRKKGHGWPSQASGNPKTCKMKKPWTCLHVPVFTLW